MREQSAVGRLARRLNYVGTALLAAAGIAFIWAVGFTHGVEGLIEGLMISALGLFLPAMATFWVAWIISVAASEHPSQSKPLRAATRPRRLWELVRNYAVAAALVVVAALIRNWLTPYLGSWVPFSTFYLAVAVSAWIGGMGPATVATAISIPMVWKWLIDLTAESPGATAELVAMAMFISVALAIAGITSALRVTRSSVALLRDEAALSEATLDEAERRFRGIADASPEMLWLGDASHARTWVNKTWLDYTGRPFDDELGDGWMQSIHPEDLQRCRTRYREGFERREPFTAVFRLLRHDGIYHRVQDDAVPRYFAGQRFAGFAGRCVETNVARGRVSVAGASASHAGI